MTRNEILKHSELATLDQIRRVLAHVDATTGNDGFYDEATGVEGGGTKCYDKPMAFIRLDEHRSVYADGENGFGFCDTVHGDLNGDADFDGEPSLDEIDGLLDLDKWIKKQIIKGEQNNG